MPGVKTNERPGTRAVLRHSRMSAYKVREVLDLIRGQDVDRAAEILRPRDREAAVVGRQGAGLGRGQRRAQRRARPRGAVRLGLLRRRGHHPQALAPPGPWPGHPDPQAHLPHHHHREPAARATGSPAAGPSRPPAGAQRSPPGGRLAPPPAGRVEPTTTDRDRRPTTTTPGPRRGRRGGRPRRRRGHRDRGRPAGGVGPSRHRRRDEADDDRGRRPTTPTAEVDRRRGRRRDRRRPSRDDTDGDSAEEKGK